MLHVATMVVFALVGMASSDGGMGGLQTEGHASRTCLASWNSARAMTLRGGESDEEEEFWPGRLNDAMKGEQETEHAGALSMISLIPIQTSTSTERQMDTASNLPLSIASEQRIKTKEW